MPVDDLRPPQQERTHLAWERILDAGVEILEEHGYAGFTIAAICARAHVSAPTIYARARNKEVLFAAVFEHGFEPIRRQQGEALASAGNSDSPEDAIRTAVLAIATTSLANDLFLRTIVLRAEDDDEVARIARTARMEVAARFRELVLRHPEHLRDASPERIDACFRVVFAALMSRVAHRRALDIGPEVDDERFITDLQDIAVRALLLERRLDRSGITLHT